MLFSVARFIPFAIFVASTTLFILSALLIFGALKNPTLISQSRFELASLGLLGILWLGMFSMSYPDYSKS